MYSKIIIAIMLFFSLLLSFQPIVGAKSNHLKEIDDMVRVAQAENLSINSWEMILKENINPDQVNAVKKQMKSHFPESTFQTTETDDVTKYIITNQQSNQVQERFIIVKPTDHSFQYEMIYQIKGAEWNKSIKHKYSIKLANVENSVFSTNSKKLGCITTKPSDIIDSVYVIKNVMKKLNVQPAENSLIEDDFVVFSGFTNEWTTAIPITDTLMNFQMAARNGLGGKTTITIGTPIIVNEY